MPVVCCSLHSQVAPVAAALAELRVAYVQVAGGALPVSLSDTLRVLKERGLVETTVAAGACVEGDVACVSVASSFAWARASGFAVAICSLGPGIVGTGTRLGHGGLAAAEAANTAAALGGIPVVAARVSGVDERDRHRGVSHHTRAILDLAPQARVGEDGEGWREACKGLPLDHMGRGPDEDPDFFEAAFAAGKLARSLAL
jgi:hypothetical protein